MSVYFRRRHIVGVGIAILVVLVLSVVASGVDSTVMQRYKDMASRVVYDRNGDVVQISLNKNEQVCLFASQYNKTVTDLVLKKEGQWFYYHPGFNVYRTARSAILHLFNVKSGGASTITQQLSKTLLYNTNERTYANKLQELVVAMVLEYKHTKEELLTMYLNTVPLGGNIQGFPAAARAYFNKQVAQLNQNETLQLVSALSNPNYAKPLSETNLERARILANTLNVPAPIEYRVEEQNKTNVWLELADTLSDCKDCTSTLDVALTERIRDIVQNYVVRGTINNITHGAVAVVDVHTGELLALVGSPDPSSLANGMRINMALETRPIGSTIKPFLYALAFSKGLRPYTLVDDREYKFAIDKGFPIYPKNYDGQYRGIVTLEESLANSLNVPSVEVLRYATLEDTYFFLEHTLGFNPPQDWSAYAYGIALGGLELDLLTLTHAFTAFANNGMLVPLVTGYTQSATPHYFIPPHSTFEKTVQVLPSEYIALVNTILTDRTAGVEQFGQAGSLFLTEPYYGVKTGTSRDYHDSWTVGYTNDFAVGVWVGNVENEPMNKVSGSVGAGTIWHDVMEYMFTTPYYTRTPINTAPVVPVENERGYSYGLPGDDTVTIEKLLLSDEVIRSPHQGDIYFYTEGMCVPLDASHEVTWYVNDVALHGNTWCPDTTGNYTISAHSEDVEEEYISVTVVNE